MTNANDSGAPRPGWYQDPAGTQGQRWWDGTQWTQYVQQPSMQQSGQPSMQQPLAPNAHTDTPFIWVIALLPVLSIIAYAAFDLNSFVAPGSSLRIVTNPMYLVITLLAWAIYGFSIWLAYLDRRALTNIGVVRPFHWAWAFLTGIVYMIGRSVIVRRRVGGGLLPMWVMIGVFILGFVVVIVKLVTLFSTIIQLYSY